MRTLRLRFGLVSTLTATALLLALAPVSTSFAHPKGNGPNSGGICSQINFVDIKDSGWSTTPDGLYAVETRVEAQEDATTGAYCGWLRAVGGYWNKSRTTTLAACSPNVGCSYVELLRYKNPETKLNVVYPNFYVPAFSISYEYGNWARVLAGSCSIWAFTEWDQVGIAGWNNQTAFICTP